MQRRRILVLVGLFLLPALVIEMRLFELQVLEGARFREEAERKVTTIELLPSMRGRILDRNGEILARDRRSFEVDLVPQRLRVASATPASVVADLGLRSERLDAGSELGARPASIARLAQLFRLRRESLEGALAEVQRRRTFVALSRLLGLPSRPWEERFEALEERILRLTAGKSRKDRGRIARRERENPIRLVSEVTYDQAAELETRMETYPGLQVVERLKREYPQGSAGGHVVGYVGKMRDDQYGAREAAGYFREELVTVIGEDEYAKRERLGEFKDDIVGAEGVEAWFDQPAADEPFRQLLRGRRGAMIQQRDLTSRTREILQHAPPTAGTDLRLTLDLRLQRSVEEALAGLLASAVVLDVRTGELLALVSTPGFDPNDFVPPASAAVVEPLLTRKDHPLLNRAVMSAYPLGSIFKVVTASAGLEERKFEPSTEFTCEGRFRTQPPYFRCWISAHGGAHGPQDLLHALMHSCNVFFCNVGQRVGGEALTGWARRFGLGRRTGVDLRGERAGGLPGRSRVTGAPHTLNPNEVLNLSIGQGQIEVTPIQVAVLMAAVANGGSVLRPILWRDDPRSRAPVDVLPLGRATLEAIRAGLAAVVMEPGGTAAKTDLRKFHAAGKTSTAEVTSSETARQLPAFYPHAWFAGYAPLEAPRFAFVVMIEHGGKGSEAAAPKAAEVLARVFARFPE